MNDTTPASAVLTDGFAAGTLTGAPRLPFSTDGRAGAQTPAAGRSGPTASDADRAVPPKMAPRRVRTW